MFTVQVVRRCVFMVRMMYLEVVLPVLSTAAYTMCVFNGAYDVCGGCLASIINSGIHDAINKCSSNCFSIFYDYTKAHD